MLRKAVISGPVRLVGKSRPLCYNSSGRGDQGCHPERPGRVNGEFGEHLQGSGGKEARLPGKGAGSEELEKGGWTELARSSWVGRLVFRAEPGLGLRKNPFFFFNETFVQA